MSEHPAFSLVKQITNTLFVPEDRRIKKLQEALIEQHDEKTKSTHKGFVYLGELYIHTKAARQHMTYPMLEFSLNPQMEVILADMKNVDQDKTLITQTLFKLVYQCNDLQEQRDSLPDCIMHACPPGISRLSRVMSSPEWILKTDQRALRQYRKILPKIEMYAAARLIY
jgi:hypothetical protein